MIPRLIVGRIYGEVIPWYVNVGGVTDAGEEWTRRLCVFRGWFFMLTCRKGEHLVYAHCGPLGKGRRLIGQFNVPGTCFPRIESNRIIFTVRIEGAPPVPSMNDDLVGLADQRWNYRAIPFDDLAEIELDRSDEGHFEEYDRIFLFREAENQVHYWPLPEGADEVTLRFEDATTVPRPDALGSL